MHPQLKRILILGFLVLFSVLFFLWLVSSEEDKNELVSIVTGNKIADYDHLGHISQLEVELSNPLANKPQIYREIINRHLLREDSVSALSTVEKAIAEFPGIVDFRVVHGDLLLSQNQLTKALDEYRFSADGETRSEESLIGELKTYSLLKKYQDVAALASTYSEEYQDYNRIKVISIISNYQDFSKTQIEELRDNFSTESFEYELISNFLEEEQGAFFLTTISFELLGTEYEVFALPLIKQAKAKNKFVDNLYIYQGIIYKNISNHEEAAKEFRRAKKINESQIDSDLNLLEVYLLSGNMKGYENLKADLLKQEIVLSSLQEAYLFNTLAGSELFEDIVWFKENFETNEKSFQISNLILARASFEIELTSESSTIVQGLDSDLLNIEQLQVYDSLLYATNTKELNIKSIPEYDSALANLYLGEVLLDRGQTNEAKIVLERSIANSIIYETEARTLLNTL